MIDARSVSRPLLLSMLITPSLLAQQPKPRVDSGYERLQAPAAPPLPAPLLQELTAIRDAALTDDYAYQQVAHLTENIGPRPVGSPQAQAAIEYVAGEMRKLGLEVRLEPVQARHWIRGAESAELVEYPGQAPGSTQKIVLTALGGNHPTPPAGITADVVVANSFAELDRLGRQNVAGKIVLFNVAFDKQKAANGYAGEAYDEAVVYRALGAKKAAALGAVAGLVRSVGGADYRLPHTGGSSAADIPAGAVTAEDADLIAHLAAQGRVRMHVILTSQTAEEVTTFNVVGDLKGSEHPEQVVIVSGHLDSWDLGTGAIDDAAGVAVAMETAQLMQQLHLRPKRTLRVIAWIDEENLGRGHLEYAKAHAAEIGQHVAAMESDLGAVASSGIPGQDHSGGRGPAAICSGSAAAFGGEPHRAQQRQSRGRHRAPGQAGSAGFRPVAGRPHLLQLPSHRGRHAGQDCSPGAAGERHCHGGHGVRPGGDARPIAQVSAPDHVRTGALARPVERSSDRFVSRSYGGASLRRTGGGARPHTVCGGPVHLFPCQTI